jgi:hypothetical protein
MVGDDQRLGDRMQMILIAAVENDPLRSIGFWQ